MSSISGYKKKELYAYLSDVWEVAHGMHNIQHEDLHKMYSIVAELILTKNEKENFVSFVIDFFSQNICFMYLSDMALFVNRLKTLSQCDNLQSNILRKSACDIAFLLYTTPPLNNLIQLPIDNDVQKGNIENLMAQLDILKNYSRYFSKYHKTMTSTCRQYIAILIYCMKKQRPFDGLFLLQDIIQESNAQNAVYSITPFHCKDVFMNPDLKQDIGILLWKVILKFLKAVCEHTHKDNNVFFRKRQVSIYYFALFLDNFKLKNRNTRMRLLFCVFLLCAMPKYAKYLTDDQSVLLSPNIKKIHVASLDHIDSIFESIELENPHKMTKNKQQSNNKSSSQKKIPSYLTFVPIKNVN